MRIWGKASHKPKLICNAGWRIIQPVQEYVAHRFGSEINLADLASVFSQSNALANGQFSILYKKSCIVMIPN